MKKIVYFHPTLNNPSLGGGDVHSHEMLETLKKMGYKLYLFIIESDRRPILTRSNWGYEKVFIFPFTLDRTKIKLALSQFIEDVNPNYIFMNYPSWDNVLDHEKHSSIKRIIYNHHFESIRKQMGYAYNDLWNAVSPNSFEEVHPDLYDLNFSKSQNFQPDPKEYQTYDQYDLTLVLQDYGASLIRKNCKKTKVISFPVTLSPRDCRPKYQRLALYTMSSYNFMFQAYYFFAKCVLPLILEQQPIFRIRLVGIGSDHLFPAPNIICKKFVMDLKKEYERVCVCLCPSFTGTGQQIKILEAMHYAIPSVCMYNEMQFNPIRHGETGFIAHNAQEFADYALLLFEDVSLAREMGEKAQQDARKHYTNKRLRKIFESIESI